MNEEITNLQNQNPLDNDTVNPELEQLRLENDRLSSKVSELQASLSTAEDESELRRLRLSDAKVARLESELKTLRPLEGEVQELQAKLASSDLLQERNQTLVAAREQWLQAEAKLKNELSDSESRLHDCQCDYKSKRIESLEKSLDVKRGKVQELEESYSKNKSDFDDSAGKIRLLEKQVTNIDQLRTKARDQGSRIAELERQKSDLEVAETSARSAFDQLKLEKTSLQQKVNKYDFEVPDLKERLAQLEGSEERTQKRLADLRSQKNDAVKETETLKTDIETKKQEIERLQSSNAQSQPEVEADDEAHTIKVKGLQAKIAKCKQELAKATSEAVKWESECDEKHAGHERTIRDLNTSKRAKDRLQKTVDELQARIDLVDQLESSNSALKATVERKGQELSRRDTEADETRKNLYKAEDARRELQSQVDAYKRGEDIPSDEVLLLRHQHKMDARTVTELRNDLQYANEQCDGKDHALGAKDRTIEAREHEIRRLRARRADLEVQVQNLGRQITDLEGQAYDWRRSYHEVMHQAKVMAARGAKLQDQLKDLVVRARPSSGDVTEGQANDFLEPRPGPPDPDWNRRSFIPGPGE